MSDMGTTKKPVSGAKRNIFLRKIVAIVPKTPLQFMANYGSYVMICVILVLHRFLKKGLAVQSNLLAAFLAVSIALAIHILIFWIIVRLNTTNHEEKDKVTRDVVVDAVIFAIFFFVTLGVFT